MALAPHLAEFHSLSKLEETVRTLATIPIPLKSEKDFGAALERYSLLARKGSRISKEEAKEREILKIIIGQFNEEFHHLPSPDPVDYLSHVMKRRGLSRKDLEPMLGSRSRVSEVLNRKRSLSLQQIRNLYRSLNIPLEVLVEA